jgi:PAS domain S-box-containing protein
MVDFLLTLNWSQIIVAVIITFGGAMLVWYRERVRSWRTFWGSVLDGLRAIPELRADVKGIRYYVSPNGGGSLMDMTHRMETALHAVTNQLELLSQTVVAENDTDESVARFHCSPDGQNIYVNQTYARWLGVGKVELLGWNFLNVIHPEDVARVQTHWAQCRAEHRQYRVTHRVIASNGEVLALAVTCTPIPEEEPAVRWVGYARKVPTDVTK